MKLINLLVILLLCTTACKKESKSGAKSTYYSFSGQIGTNDNSTCPSSDGNLLICGNVNDNLSLLKVSKSGTEIWRRNFNPGLESAAASLTELNGEIFICGRTARNYSSTNYDILLVKTTAAGDTIWTKTYGSTEEDQGKNIIRTSDGNILISAITYGFGAGSFGDIYLVKVDPNGNVIWETTYPDPDQEVPFHLLETQNGEYLVTGTNEDNGQPRELYLLKVNNGGQMLWNKKIGPAIWKWGYSTIETASGELVICGQRTIAMQQSQVLLIKTTNLGNVLWEKEYGDSTFGISEKGNSVKQNPDGTFTIAGSVYDAGTGQTKIILLKADENGNQLWFKKVNDYFGGNALNLLKDGNDNILTGNRNGSIFMVRTDGDGAFK